MAAATKHQTMPNSGPDPYIMAGVQASMNAVNAMAAADMGKKTRAWNEKMYSLQREHALADYNMQNEYNSPAAMMARYRDAGLNPNLIYGNGTSEGAANVRSASAPSWNPETPNYGAIGTSAISAYYDVQLKEAQVDNLKTQNTIMVQDALLRAEQVKQANVSTGKTALESALASFELHQKEGLAKYSIPMVEAELQQKLASTKALLDDNERKRAMQAPTLTKAFQEIVNMRLQAGQTQATIDQIRQTIKNLGLEATLKQLEINMNQMGIQKHDNIFFRVLGGLVNRVLGNPMQMVPSLK